jgi:plastocyanin
MRSIAAGLLIALVLVGAENRAGAEPQVLQGIVRVNGRPAKDVVVWLDRSGPVAPAAGRAVLDQRNMTFVPRLLVVPVGTTVEMPNSDRVFHNVFSFHNGKRFDLGLYPAGTRKLVTFDQPGVSRVFCNIHPTMAAYVVVVASTRFAVTDASGQFAIADVEGGRHGFSMWRAGADPYSGTIASAQDHVVTLDWP